MTRAAGRATGKTAPNPAGVIARLKANLIARYGLANVPGRPDELRKPGTDRAVSVQYGCQMVRIRLLEGRKWVEVFDLNLAKDEQANRKRCFQVLDAWFEVIEGLNGRMHDVRTLNQINIIRATGPGHVEQIPGRYDYLQARKPRGAGL